MWTSSLPEHVLVSFQLGPDSAEKQYAYFSFADVISAYTFVYIVGARTVCYNQQLEATLKAAPRGVDQRTPPVSFKKLLSAHAFTPETDSWLREQSLQQRALCADPGLRFRLIAEYPADRPPRRSRADVQVPGPACA
jgi:hypothetical protein